MNEHDSSKLIAAFNGALARNPLAAIATVLDVALPQWNLRGLPGAPPSPLAKVQRDAQLADALNGAIHEFDNSERAARADAERALIAERNKLRPVMYLVPRGDPHAPAPAVDPIEAEKRYRAILDSDADLASQGKGDFLTNVWLAELFIKTACKITSLPREEGEGHRQWHDGRCADWLRSNGYITADRLIEFPAFLVAALAAGVPVRRAGSGPMNTYFGLKLPVGRDFRPGTVRVA